MTPARLTPDHPRAHHATVPSAASSPFLSHQPPHGPQTLAHANHVEWGRIFDPEQPIPTPPREPEQTPERKLLAAVLEQAIAIVMGEQSGFPALAHNRVRAEAIGWFASADRYWPMSFENICDVLGIDPDYVRRGIRNILTVGQQRDSRRRRREMPGSAPQRRARIVARAA